MWNILYETSLKSWSAFFEMEKSSINEAFFWKHLTDVFIEHLKLNKKVFYEKVKPVKSIWDIENIDKISEDVVKAAKNKTNYVKENFMKIISDLENSK
jgi:hypothetical protein